MNTKYKFYTIVASAILGLSSCKKMVDDAYVNPNADVIKPIEQLLPGVIQNMVVSNSSQGTLYGTQNDGLYIGRYVQFWSTNSTNNQYDQMGGATGASDILGSVWAMHYFGQGQNISKIIQWGTEQKKWDYVGVAHAIRAWGWLNITDVYGDAILKDAWNTSQLVFGYETQQEILEEVKRQSFLALENLNKTGDGVSQANLAIGDAFGNNGDVEKWKRFTYGVLARCYNRYSNKANYNPDSVIHYSKLAITDNSLNTYVTFTGVNSPTSSYYGPFRGNIGTLRQSKFIADLQSGVNASFAGVQDPRAIYLIRSNPNGTFKGVRPTKGTDGLAVDDRPENFWGGAFSVTTGSLANSRYIFRDAMPWPVMTAPEFKFLIAEAYYKKGMKAEARTAYSEGIAQSFDLLTSKYNVAIPAGKEITTTIKDNFLANPLVVPAQNDLTLSHIMLQKYIALYGYGLVETWVDLRRYNYIDVESGTTRQVYDGFEPPAPSDLYVDNRQKLVNRARPRYNSEYLYNVDALDKIGARSLDYHTKPMWFSQP